MRPILLLFLAACERTASSEHITLAFSDAIEHPAMHAMATASEPQIDPALPFIEESIGHRGPVGRDLVGLRTPVKRWFLAMTASNRHIVRSTCRLRRASPCWQMRHLAPVHLEGEGREVRESDRFHPFGQSAEMDEFCSRTEGDAACTTPLVVAFADAPVAYTPATHRFAFRGTPLLTDWPTAATPWLALDRDGDGAITSGFELFGDATAKNGFLALAALDANGDGVLDRADPDFAKLVLWSDRNADRTSSPDELRPLSEVIDAIPLAYRMDVRCAGDNCEGERGTARLVGGGTATVIDIYLAER